MTADDVVEDGEQARRGIDARPAKPSDIAVRIDKRRSPPIGEQSMFTDGVLHGAEV
jgi:hypothetical protein